MELVYLWVEEYKNIHRQGFNFSPRFNCHYDEDSNELTIDENDGYIENFFGENINVTAIVGKNGSGKSSIAEILQRIFVVDFFARIEKNDDIKYILLLKVAPDLHSESDFYDLDKQILALTNMEDTDLPVGNIGSRSHREADDLMESIFLDSQMPYNQYNGYETAQKNFSYDTDFNYIKEHFFVDLDYREICKKLVKLGVSNWTYGDFVPYKISVKEKKNMMKDPIDSFMYNLHVYKRFPEISSHKIKKAEQKITDFQNIFLFSLLLSHIDRIDEEVFEKELDKIIDPSTKGKSITSILSNMLSSVTDQNYREYVDVFYEQERITNIDMDLVKRYFDYIDIEIFDHKGRSFHSLSHGEKMILGIEINLFYAIQNTVNDNFLIVFDEPDLSLHPNWQKAYLHKIMNIFKQLGKNIHFVFTTHSPFLLSDIPKQNIIFLDTDESGKCKVLTKDQALAKQQTFGQNIHTLLSDSFFMENGLMGEFAKSKIEKVISFLRTDSQDEYNPSEEITIKEAEKIIDIIGEPLLKMRLEKMMVDYKKNHHLLDRSAIEKQIEELQNKLTEMDSHDHN